MPPSGFYIRKAEPEDVDTILQLVIALATCEKEPDSVKATPQLLRKNLFETPFAHALLAFSGSESPTSTSDEPIGLALYFFNYSTWTGRPGLFLEDLYVKPEHRNKGVGKAFFGELGKIAQEKECARLDWAVLKWNQPSISFYEKTLEPRVLPECMGMRLEGEKIERLKKFVVDDTPKEPS